MVAGLRSIAKAMELPPEPNVRAPALDPTLGEGASAMTLSYPTSTVYMVWCAINCCATP
jgi:hypothetical protein